MTAMADDTPASVDRRCARLTAARIGLGRAGASLPTAPLLDFAARPRPRPRRRARPARRGEPGRRPRRGSGLPVLPCRKRRRRPRALPACGPISAAASTRTPRPRSRRMPARYDRRRSSSPTACRPGRCRRMHAPTAGRALLPHPARGRWRIAPLVVADQAASRSATRSPRRSAPRCSPCSSASARASARPTASAPISPGSRGRRPPTPTATASPTSGPTASATPDAAHRLAHLLHAMRVRRVSGVQLKASASAGGWRHHREVPSLEPMNEDLDRPHPHHAHRQPAAAEAAAGPHPRPREGRHHRRRHLPGRDRQGGRRGRGASGRRTASTSSATAR